jgi:starch-binding outer membrane protein, SusD/RagB family
MKKIIKNIILLAGLTFVGFSCSDYLDEEGYKTDYTYYNSTDGLNALVISAYQQTRFACSYENQYGIEDMGTDIYMLGGDGGYRDAFGQFLSSAMTPQNGLCKNFWDNDYKGIAACNLGLQYMETNATMDTATKRIRKGELQFLRAYYYYELAIQFGAVPLVLKCPDAPKFDYLRAPQSAVWAQIIADARQAWANLPWATADGKVTGNFGRVSKGAAGHLLAKAYLFRSCDQFTKSESDANMNEDRGSKSTDIDSVIYFASRVCNFGEGAGSGSNHSLCPDLTTLWGWNQKTGLSAEYMGPEIVFSINYSSTYFYNNVGATEVSSGGNWNHLLYTGQMENYPLNTGLSDGTSISFGSNVGVTRDLITGRPWRRLSPTPWYYAEDGLYAPKNYETNIKGKLVDARLYKSHVWTYYCNNAARNVAWSTMKIGNDSITPEDLGYVTGSQKYEVGDTAILISTENLLTSGRIAKGTNRGEKLAWARAQEKYWLVPMLSIKQPMTRGEVAGYDVMTNQFPPLAKYMDNRRAAIPDQAGFRNFMRFRLAETYIILSEAYARKSMFTEAAEALNMVRVRAAWKDGETKYAQYWKYDGGTWANRTASTENDMRVSATFIGSKTGTDLTDFYVDEMGRETAGELNRFDILVRYGADYWYNKVKACDYWVSNDNGQSAGNIHIYHRFRPIPQSHIDIVEPKDPNGQNYGY